MRASPVLLLFLLTSAPGCSFVGHMAHNLASAPLDYVHESCLHARVRHLAHTEWQKIAATEPEPRSHSYARGFKDGFVDYVESNGDGQPPAMPPHRLWRQQLHELAGPDNIEDWYDGFARGAAEAKSRQLRDLVVVPIGRAPRETWTTPNRAPSQPRMAPPIETLPQPKPLE